MSTDKHEVLCIVHVCCTDAFAGVERHVAELARAQAEVGHDVTIVGGDRRRVGSVAGSGVRLRAGEHVVTAIRSLQRLPRRPDVLNAHMSTAEAAVALSLRHRQVPLVSTRHFAARRGSKPVTRPFIRLAARRVAAQLAVSNFVAEHIDGPSIVVLSGVPSRLGRTPACTRDRSILVAQRLETEKKTHVAMEAFARSGLQHVGWRLDIAGSGSLRHELEQEARKLAVGDAVHFLGHREDVHRLMDTTAIFLAPRPDEAFGLSVVEAMAHGLPVVAAGAGAHLETVGSVTGARLFAPGDVEQAAGILRELAGSEEAREDYGARLQSAQRASFDVRQQSRATESLYRSLL